MSGPTSRDQRRERTRQRIRDVAVALFEEHGYEEVTVGTVARAAGVSVPTFYTYFPGKEHLLISLPDRELLDAILAEQPVHLPLSERVRGAILPYLTAMGPEQLGDVLVRWRIVARTPALRNRAAEFERMTADLIYGAMTGSDEPALGSRPGEVAVAAVLAAYTQILLRWAASDGERKLDELADEVFTELREM